MSDTRTNPFVSFLLPLIVAALAVHIFVTHPHEEAVRTAAPDAGAPAEQPQGAVVWGVAAETPGTAPGWARYSFWGKGDQATIDRFEKCLKTCSEEKP